MSAKCGRISATIVSIGFFEEFIPTVFSSAELVQAGYLMIHALAGQIYLPEFAAVMQFLSRVLHLNGELQAGFMSLIAVLNGYPQLRPLFSAYQIPKVVATMTVPESHQQSRQEFLMSYPHEKRKGSRMPKRK
jgi:hypothetical protein